MEIGEYISIEKYCVTVLDSFGQGNIKLIFIIKHC